MVRPAYPVTAAIFIDSAGFREQMERQSEDRRHTEPGAWPHRYPPPHVFATNHTGRGRPKKDPLEFQSAGLCTSLILVEEHRPRAIASIPILGSGGNAGIPKAPSGSGIY